MKKLLPGIKVIGMKQMLSDVLLAFASAAPPWTLTAGVPHRFYQAFITSD